MKKLEDWKQWRDEIKNDIPNASEDQLAKWVEELKSEKQELLEEQQDMIKGDYTEEDLAQRLGNGNAIATIFTAINKLMQERLDKLTMPPPLPRASIAHRRLHPYQKPC